EIGGGDAQGVELGAQVQNAVLHRAHGGEERDLFFGDAGAGLVEAPGGGLDAGGVGGGDRAQTGVVTGDLVGGILLGGQRGAGETGEGDGVESVPGGEAETERHRCPPVI